MRVILYGAIKLGQCVQAHAFNDLYILYGEIKELLFEHSKRGSKGPFPSHRIFVS